MIFTPRSECCLKICLEDRFATTKDIKSKLESSDIHASERTVRRRLSDLQVKAYRPAGKPKLTAAMKVKRLNWARDLKDKKLDFWKSVSNCANVVFFFLVEYWWDLLYMSTNSIFHFKAWKVGLILRFPFLWKVCLSDESTFEILAKKFQFVRRRPDEKYHPECVVQTVKHQTNVMIWSVISGT